MSINNVRRAIDSPLKKQTLVYTVNTLKFITMCSGVGLQRSLRNTAVSVNGFVFFTCVIEHNHSEPNPITNLNRIEWQRRLWFPRDGCNFNRMHMENSCI